MRKVADLAGTNCHLAVDSEIDELDFIDAEWGATPPSYHFAL